MSSSINIPTSPLADIASKGKERAVDNFDDIQLDPREVNWGDRTPRPNDYASPLGPDYVDFDNFE
jgi:hypothetical protein